MRLKSVLILIIDFISIDQAQWEELHLFFGGGGGAGPGGGGKMNMTLAVFHHQFHYYSNLDNRVGHMLRNLVI